MADIFGADGKNKPAVVSASFAKVSCGMSKGVAMGINIQFSRQFSPLYTLGKGLMYSVQDPLGTCTIESMVTDGSMLDGVGGMGKCTLGDDLKLTLQSECSAEKEDGGNASGQMIYTLKNIYCTAVNVRAQGGQGYVMEGVTITFNSMSTSS